MVFLHVYNSILQSLRELVSLFEPVISYVREAFSILPSYFFPLSSIVLVVLVFVKPDFVVLFFASIFCVAVSALLYKILTSASTDANEEEELSPEQRAKMYLKGRTIT